ncbi:hypothetical protein OAK75_00080 [Bacteriovoracales bacterium]|nr:hypothetical protein [Bacteriovoracales bacterium]
MKSNFFNDHEKIIEDNFLEDGYIESPLKNYSFVLKIRYEIYKIFEENYLSSTNRPKDIDYFFDNTHLFIPQDELNKFRLEVIKKMNSRSFLRPKLYQNTKSYINSIVGNELSMQRNVNFSIQYPHDKSSLLPLHSDVWNGNSPYEVVLWVPLTDCYKTRSMYLIPRKKNDQIMRNFKQYSYLDSENLFKEFEKDFIFLNTRLGSYVIFSHTLMHGNRLNDEPHTRWSINVRFKSLLSPYRAKELGETFEPITIRPLTRLGFDYFTPEV